MSEDRIVPSKDFTNAPLCLSGRHVTKVFGFGDKKTIAVNDDELWLVLESELLHLVVVHATCFLVQVIAYRIVEYSRCIYCRTM